MNSKSKLARHIDEEDRISNLPDSILSHILSLLPTKFAVATAILSKRWKTIWTCLSSLDLSDSIFFHPEISFINPREKLSFINFVDRVLMIRDPSLNLNKFSLNCSGNCDLNRVSQWVRVAIRQNIQEMNLQLILRQFFELPPTIFTCDTLVVQQLSWKVSIDVPENVCLPSLKVLHFNGVIFSNYDSMEKITCGCPVLEDLVVISCQWLQGCSLTVYGLALKNLTLRLHLRLPTYPLALADCEYKIAVDAPSLESLIIKDYRSEKFSMKNLNSLVKANVDVAKRLERSITADEYGNHAFELLGAISNVKVLSLSGETMEALFYGYDHTFPKFHNLSRLELSVDGWHGWTLLPNLLASSPNLEDLVFAKGLIPNFHFQLGVFRFNWSPPEHVPHCLLLHLKAIEIKTIIGEPEELKLVQYFLKNAKVLKKMSLDCCMVKENVKFWKRIFKFPRGSMTCELDLVF